MIMNFDRPAVCPSDFVAFHWLAVRSIQPVVLEVWRLAGQNALTRHLQIGRRREKLLPKGVHFLGVLVFTAGRTPRTTPP